MRSLAEFTYSIGFVLMAPQCSPLASKVFRPYAGPCGVHARRAIVRTDPDGEGARLHQRQPARVHRAERGARLHRAHRWAEQLSHHGAAGVHALRDDPLEQPLGRQRRHASCAPHRLALRAVVARYPSRSDGAGAPPRVPERILVSLQPPELARPRLPVLATLGVCRDDRSDDVRKPHGSRIGRPQNVVGGSPKRPLKKGRDHRDGVLRCQGRRSVESDAPVHR